MSVAIDPLKGAVRGAVIEPGDEGYEEARLVMNRRSTAGPRSSSGPRTPTMS